MKVRQNIRSILDDTNTAFGRFIAYSIQILIVFSLITFSINTLPHIPGSVKRLLQLSEFIIIGLFTIEYLARLYSAEKPFRFIFSFYGLVDLLAIAPFYLASGVDLRAARAFRLLRMFRIFKLVRYSKALDRLSRSISSIKEELVLSAALSLILLFLSSVGIYIFEHEAQPEQFSSVFHCLWWAVTTLTTVGYGDMYPITLGGKVFTFFVLAIGLGIVAIPTALFASALTKHAK